MTIDVSYLHVSMFNLTILFMFDEARELEEEKASCSCGASNRSAQSHSSCSLFTVFFLISPALKFARTRGHGDVQGSLVQLDKKSATLFPSTATDHP